MAIKTTHYYLVPRLFTADGEEFHFDGFAPIVEGRPEGDVDNPLLALLAKIEAPLYYVPGGSTEDEDHEVIVTDLARAATIATVGHAIVKDIAEFMENAEAPVTFAFPDISDIGTVSAIGDQATRLQQEMDALLQVAQQYNAKAKIQTQNVGTLH